MGDGYFRGGARPASPARVQTVRVYLRHHNKPEFNPEPSSCQDNDEKHRKGCGAALIFYRTYPNEKRMPFDGAPTIVEGSEANMGDGGIVASVYTDNVHFSTCPHYGNNAARQDTKAAAAGRD